MSSLPRNTVLVGDSERVLSGLIAESVDTVITSPPYPGSLRDYGMAGQLGREPTVGAYVRRLRVVLRQVRRVLKPAGSLWLNVGDVYAKSAGLGVPRRSLLLAPERIALALSADGWLVRNVCIWHKSNPLPQSARDRLSPTYEFVLFATKQSDYYFDLDAVRVPHRSAARTKPSLQGIRRTYQGGNRGLAKLKASGRPGNAAGKNPGDVWTMATAADRFGHQATFPESLVELPILASCPEVICTQCDAAWRRPVRVLTVHSNEGPRSVRRVGELDRCDCFAPTRPGLVLDPFCGTATVGVVAERLRRDWLGIELNPAYVRLAQQRLAATRARVA